MISVGVVDYRMGNLASVSKAIEQCGSKPMVSDSRSDLAACDVLLLPGVGNFQAGIGNLERVELDQFIVDWCKDDKPFIGICLGMQLLFGSSEESESKGLGILEGEVLRLPSSVKIPHMGWNKIKASSSEIFEGSSGRYFYFVHSYYCVPFEQSPGATTSYGVDFIAGLQSKSICGMQFHPEKSGRYGLDLLAKSIEVIS